MMHKRILAMNVVGAFGWAIAGYLLMISHSVGFFDSIPTATLFLYALIVLVPAITAYSLFRRHTAKLNLMVQALNYFLSTYFIFSYIQVALAEKTMSLKSFDWALFISLVLVVLPSIINIRSLRHLRK